MADETINISEAEIERLAEAIKNSPIETLGAQDEFCRLWPTAKEVLTLLRNIVGVIPGAGMFAGLAISAVLAAGEAAQKAICPQQ
jgi:hypothetical protein